MKIIHSEIFAGEYNIDSDMDFARHSDYFEMLGEGETKKIYSQWRTLLEALNNKTKKIKLLDLGCGAESGNMESVKYDNEYFPWLGRFIYQTRKRTGIEYVGVDCGDISNELFYGRQLNLLDRKSLINEFPPNYFDIAVAFMLFNSPELERAITGRDRPNASSKSAKILAKSMVPQLEKIVKQDGIFLWCGGDVDL